MIQKIPVRPRNDAAHFAIEAIAASFSTKDLPMGQERSVLEVEFRVNGVDLPFDKTIETAYALIYSEMDERAAKKALDLFNTSGLQETLDEANRALRQAIDKAFGTHLLTDLD